MGLEIKGEPRFSLFLFGIAIFEKTVSILMEKTNNTSTRGGSRPGAGRKSMGETAKNETIGLRIRPELKERLFQVAKERGISASELMARLIESL